MAVAIGDKMRNSCTNADSGAALNVQLIISNKQMKIDINLMLTTFSSNAVNGLLLIWRVRHSPTKARRRCNGKLKDAIDFVRSLSEDNEYSRIMDQQFSHDVNLVLFHVAF